MVISARWCGHDSSHEVGCRLDSRLREDYRPEEYRLELRVESPRVGHQSAFWYALYICCTRTLPRKSFLAILHGEGRFASCCARFVSSHDVARRHC